MRWTDLRSDRRDRRGVLVSPRIGRDVRQLEELPPGVRPTECKRDHSFRARWVVQRVVAAVGSACRMPVKV